MRYEIRELGVGGILDQAVTLLKNHFGLLLGVTLVLYIPYALAQNFVNLAITPQLPANPTREDFIAYQQEAAGNLPIVLPMLFILVFVVVPITNAGIIHAIASEYLAKSTSVGQAMRRALQVIIPLVWTWFLQMLAIMGGMVLFIIPGIFFAFWFALSTHVVVIEGTSGTTALGRSKQLMKGNIGTLLTLGIVVGLIQWGIIIAAAFIPQPHLQIVGQVFAGAILTIFAAAAFVVFYFSCRCKHENFDLTLLAQSVGAEAPDEAAADDSFQDSFEE